MSVSFAKREQILTHEKIYSLGPGGVTLPVEDAVPIRLHWTVLGALAATGRSQVWSVYAPASGGGKAPRHNPTVSCDVR